jgi:hypothetical protein
MHSGGEENQRGNVVILNKRTSQIVQRVCYKEVPPILVRLMGKPAETVIVQVCMSKSDYKNEEIEEFYQGIEEMINERQREEIIKVPWLTGMQ